MAVSWARPGPGQETGSPDAARWRATGQEAEVVYSVRFIGS
jgi:hypothetical protein